MDMRAKGRSSDFLTVTIPPFPAGGRAISEDGASEGDAQAHPASAAGRHGAAVTVREETGRCDTHHLHTDRLVCSTTFSLPEADPAL
jgi:hypothetical protein